MEAGGSREDGHAAVIDPGALSQIQKGEGWGSLQQAQNLGGQ